MPGVVLLRHAPKAVVARPAIAAMGRTFAGEDDCLGTCDRKSQCNPGWEGTQWSERDKCPLNVCCSDFGWCGTTELFCGDDNVVDRPSCDAGSTSINRVIGYFEAWSTTERSCYNMLPDEIPYGYYTHLNFAFATIDPETFKILPGNSHTDSFMTRIGAIKMIQPDIQIWVAVGGWAFNDAGATQSVFTELAASTMKTYAFIDSLIKLMNKYGFDGIDIDWEYPVASERSGREEDFDNFVTFCQRLRQRLNDDGLKKGISLTLPSSYWYLQHFDISRLQHSIDWFNLMSYDLHGSWDIDNKWTGPYVNAHTNLTEIQMALDLLWRNDIDPQKVVLGMSYYSRSFTLVDPGCNVPGCVVASAGTAGPCSHTAGILLHGEIQDIIRENDLSPTLDKEAAVKTISWGNQWVSFDDADTWKLKADLARGQCVSGVMVWAISQDDGDGTNVKALTSAIDRKVMKFPDFDPPQPVEQEPPKEAQLCRWSGCYQGCPSGFKEVPRDGTELIMSDNSLCLDGGVSKFCCPSDQPLPTCLWRGHRNSGWCKAGCDDGEVEVGTLSVGCNIEHQSACCKSAPVVAAYGDCRWQGSAPSCDINSDCGGDYPLEIVKTNAGEGGEQRCVTGSKKYCCKNPKPNAFAGTCKWFTKGSPPRFSQNFICEDSCPEGQIKIATMVEHPGDCFGGAKAFCCDPLKLVPLDPRDPKDDPFGGGQVKEFRLLIQKYMENPTCPATVLQVDLHDYFVDPMAATKKRRDIDVLVGRATECTIEGWSMLLAFAVSMFSYADSSLNPLRNVWDDEFAGSYDEAYLFKWLNDFWHDYPSIDIHSLIEHVLFDPFRAGQGLRQRRRASTVFCELPPSTLTERGGLISANNTIKRRTINAWADNNNGGVPSLITILQGINRNDLPLFYARWQYQSGIGGNGHGGPLLEIAYQIPSGAQYDQYRDTNRNAHAQDNYVVFHFHVNPVSNNPMLRQFGGMTYLGVEALRVFHGQTMRYFAPGTWPRVDNGDETLNARDGFDCGDVSPGGLWYVGRPRPTDQIQSDWEVAFQTWSEELFRDGYVASTGLSLIFEGAAYDSNGQIDPNNPGRLLFRGEASTAANGGDPYAVNWVVEDGHLTFYAPPVKMEQDLRDAQGIKRAVNMSV
ncbi:glycoside hydrolase [Hypomontagnella monticulosa]|nr:glycoside hydrolase [Hypomontagnella monticulosa]